MPRALHERETGMTVKVLIAFSNRLFSEGIRKLLEGTGDIQVAGTVEPGASPREAMESLRPDCVLVDFTTLFNGFGDDGPASGRFILLDTRCGEENIVSAVLTKGLKGVLSAGSTPLLLKKAIRAVACGEIWLDKIEVKNILTGLHALKKAARPSLSEREWEVVSLVGQGFRNKEIALRLCISEPTVKTHLQRIFHKLDIQNRPQLITFALRNRNERQAEGNA